MHVLRGQNLVETKWKNGGGITRNIATGVLNDTTAWRVSRADVAVEGPFSNFAGLTRILTVVTPHRMILAHEAGTLTAQSWEPLEFDGGLSVTSLLPDGPLTDLNLMFDPTLCAATAQTERGTRNIYAPQGRGICILHVLSGQPRCGSKRYGEADTLFLAPNDQAHVELGQGDAVLRLSVLAIDHKADIRLCIADR